MMWRTRYLRTKALFYWICATVFGEVSYKDKFGLRYFISKDTRLIDTVVNGVRTDDTGVIFHVSRILDALVDRKNRITSFDVGAYMGVISLAMASRLNDRGEVFSFEPNTSNYRRLTRNIELSGYSNIFPQKMAVSESVERDVSLQVTDDPGGCFIRANNELATYHAQENLLEERVDTITVDEFAKTQDIECIDILKIDAEGYDDKVLIGARNLLESGYIYYIFCEFHEDMEYSRQCLAILETHNYEVLYIVRNGDYLVRDLDSYPFDQYKPPLNILAVSPKAPVFTQGQGLDIRGQNLPTLRS